MASHALQLSNIYLKQNRRRKDKTLTKAVISGVINYGHNVKADGTVAFTRLRVLDLKAERVVNLVMNHLTKQRLAVRVRSEPSADADLCFMVFSPHVVRGIEYEAQIPTKESKHAQKARLSGQEVLAATVKKVLKLIDGHGGLEHVNTTELDAVLHGHAQTQAELHRPRAHGGT